MSNRPLTEAEFAFVNIFEVLVDILLATGVPDKVISELLDERVRDELHGFAEATALVTSLKEYAGERRETLDRIRKLIEADAKGRA